MALGRVNRNNKWRFNDIVFIKSCGKCGVTVEWQAEDPNENNANNFHRYLFQKGWKKQSSFFISFQDNWICEAHR